MSSTADIKLLVGEEDKYGGVIVTNVEWPVEVATFVGCLKASIAKWREEGKRGVWLKLPIEMASLVPVAVQEGFWYHHAEPTYLMLVYWIPNTPHTLPSNASHRVGVGALVVNNKKEVLVVQEKDGFFGGTGVWKIPTGVIEEGEDISVGAVREVQEETGVETEFLELLTLRHLHHSYFTKSDLFFICVLQPLTLDIVKREEEIEDAQWMPFEEFYNQPFMQKHDIMRKSTEICKSWIDGRSQGFTPERVLGELPCCFYFSQRDTTGKD